MNTNGLLKLNPIKIIPGLLTCLLLIFYSNCYAVFSFSLDPSKPWKINADKLIFADDKYTARGKVSLTKQDGSLEADRLVFNNKKYTLSAQGDVLFTYLDNYMTGDALDLDIKKETGIIYNGTIFYKANNLYLKSDKIQKTSRHSYSFDTLSISACDGDKPDWHITGNDAKITIEGYASVKNSIFWIKGLPVFYMPYFIYPVKLKRQTGFLIPRFEYSDRKGFSYEQPFFWAISKDTDASFYEEIMEKRGLKHGMEFRYVLSEKSKGSFFINYLRDKKIDTGSENTKLWGYDNDHVNRSNKNRYWLCLKSDQQINENFFMSFNLDLVKDQDYLRDFKKGFSGFDNVKDYFEKEFHRSIQEDDEYVRTNNFILYKNWKKYVISTRLIWQDDIIARNNHEDISKEDDFPIQKIPQIEFSSIKQKFLSLPVYYDFHTQFSYLYSDEGLSGHRSILVPALYFPMNFKNFFYVDPSVKLNYNFWYLDKEENNNTKYQQTTYNFSCDFSTEISKYFTISNSKIIKHIIRPEIKYKYIPENNDSHDPYFDSLDRINKANLVKYSLTNILISRDNTKTQQNKNSELNEFFRFYLGQEYDIDKAKNDDKDSNEPFSPITGELEWKAENISINSEAKWSIYEKYLEIINSSIKLWKDNNNSLFVEHRYEKNNKESVFTKINFKPLNWIEFFGESEYDLFSEEHLNSGFGFKYFSQCWSFHFKLSHDAESDDTSYQFMFKLKGL